MNEETKLQNKCNLLLRKEGLTYFKHSEKWLSGIPDVQILTTPPVWVEYKTAIGKTSKIQGYTMGLLEKAGHHCFIVRSTEELKEVIRGIRIRQNQR